MTADPHHPSPQPTTALPSVALDSKAVQESPPSVVRGRVLIVAYHFPPQAGSSGLLRSLKFCRYLPEFGWLPTVLTIDPRAYEQADPSLMAEVPAFVNVTRAFGLDSQRHLSLGGRYLRASALPDRWVTWLAGAIPAGLHSIRKHKIDIIFTTYLTEEGFPVDRRTRSIYQRLTAFSCCRPPAATTRFRRKRTNTFA